MFRARRHLLMLLFCAAASAEPIDRWWESAAEPNAAQLEETLASVRDLDLSELETIWRRLWGLGRIADAKSLLQEARRHSDEPRRQAYILHQLALLHANQREHESFLAYTDSAFASIRRAAAADSIELGMLGLSRASALAELDRRQESLLQLGQARALLSRHLPAEDDRQLRVRLLASICLSNLGEYGQAALLQRQNLEALQLQADADPLQLGFSHHNLGVSLHAISEFDEAREAWQEALLYLDPEVGSTHPHAATTWLNLATLELQLGRHAVAQLALSRSMDLYESSGRAPDLLLVAALSTLGSSYLASDDTASARHWLERALSTGEKVQPANHPTMIAARYRLARTLLNSGSAMRALPLLNEALELENSRSRHVLTLRPLLQRELARAYVAAGERSRARTAFGAARDELIERYPQRGDLLTRVDLDIALLEGATVERLQRILARMNDTRGAASVLPDAELEVARELLRRGELDAAFELSRRSLKAGRAAARSMTQLMGEAQALRHLSILKHHEAILLTVLTQLTTAERVEDSFVAVARSRGLIQSEMLRRHRLRTQNEGGELEEAWRDLETLRAQLLYARESSLIQEDPDQQTTSLEELELLVERAEIRCAALSRELQLTTDDDWGLEELRRALGEDCALVSYVHWTDAGEGRYGAFVLDSESLRWVALGTALPIDARVEELRRHMLVAGPLLRLDPSRAEAEARNILQALGSAIWDPLQVDESYEVLVIPDRELHFVSFGALSGSGSEYLIEELPSLHRLVAESELLLDAPADQGQGIVLIEDSETELPSATAELAAIRGLAESTGFAPIERLDGANIGEALLRERLRDRSILHFAAHGIADQAEGLLPSGAIRLTGCSDGVLDALELGSFPLDGTRWCLLSTCLGGEGSSWPGEGVLGLQRALRGAGVRTLFVSLWPLEDQFARELMIRLYTRRWTDEESTAVALSGARRDLLQSLRERGWSSHPLRWAGMVAMGDWR